MIYYQLGKNVDPKVVGVSHGAGQLKVSNTFNELNKWHYEIFHQKPQESWKNWAKYELYAPKTLVGLILEEGAKLTDFIDDGLRGFFVNDRLKAILEEAHLPNHKFLPTIFTKEKTGQPVEGYWHFVYDMETGENTVNFSQSEYNLKYHKQKFGEDFTVSINTYQDYMNVFYQTGRAIATSLLVFNSSFDQELDIFGTQFLSTQKAYISERLFKRWQEANITGYIARLPAESRLRAERLGLNHCELVF
ncbi:hypothetical protein GO755_40025 [Spirosoma sp. HMF4905]|uniref:Uncharacterized protein n=1 Tax=Spirosoma arboris TaxID=2682092 RepID=A0A7K1SR24_9BACT|nr:hypothetical protein [Spirosoma arboris]MVM36265.1 hypothetical protein [Spirosoma arboris]